MTEGGSVLGANPYQQVRSSAQANRTQGSVLSFPLFRPFKVCKPPAETPVLRMRREAQLRRYKHGVIPCVGDVAQLGEHLLCKQGVGGSSPLISTSTLTTE